MKDLKVSVDTTCLPILHLESFAKNIGKIAPAKKKLQPQAKQWEAALQLPPTIADFKI